MGYDENELKINEMIEKKNENKKIDDTIMKKNYNYHQLKVFEKKIPTK